MISLLPFVLFLSICFQVNLTRPLERPSQWLHQQCHSWLDPQSNPKNLSVSFICGQKVTDESQKNLLQKSGLYHAIVVSGGHFIFLESALKRLALPGALRFIILWLYYLMTGLQAPGLRCLTQMMVSTTARKWGLKTNSVSLVFFSGLICLAINVQFWQSLSFWLSFAVSLALAVASEFRTQKDKLTPFFLPVILIYIFLIPFNLGHGYMHPLNMILGYALIIPFSLFLLIQSGFILLSQIDWLSSLYDLAFWANDFVFQILKKWTLLIPEKNTARTDLLFYWLYVLVLVFVSHILIVQFRRETIHE